MKRIEACRHAGQGLRNGCPAKRQINGLSVKTFNALRGDYTQMRAYSKNASNRSGYRPKRASGQF